MTTRTFREHHHWSPLCALLIALGTATLPATTNDFAILRHFAGGGVSSADHIPATNAYLDTVTGIALDAAGNVYYCDQGPITVRRIDAVTREVTTVAGRPGEFGYDGDGGPATNATFGTPAGLSLDAAGENLYFADSFNHCVRKVNLPSGIISTLVGDGNPGAYNEGDGGPANLARLNSPEGVAVAPNGDVYIADTLNYVIRKVTLTNGIITHVAGSPVGPFPFTRPERLAIDRKGNIFVANDSGTGSTVWRINGTNYSDVTRVVGGGAGDGQSGPPTNALINVSGPLDVAVDDHGGVYVGGVGRYWRADLRTQTIAVFAGLGSNPSTGSTFAGLDGPARDASLKYATALAVGPDSTVYLNNYDPNLMLSVSQNVVVDDPDSQAFVSGQTNLTGNLIVEGTTLTNLEACELALLQGNLNISSNANLLAFCLTNLDTVTGDIITTGNGSIGIVDLSVTNVGGDVIVTGNGALGIVDLGINDVGGDVIVSGSGGVGFVDLSITNVEGDVIVVGNGSVGFVDFSVGTVGQDAIVSGNGGAGLINFSTTEVGGDAIVSGNAGTGSVDFSSGTVAGDVVVTDNGGAATNGTGMVNVSADSVGGSVTVTNNSGSTNITLTTGAVTNDVLVSGNDSSGSIDVSPGDVGGNVIVTGNTGAAVVVVGGPSVDGNVMVTGNTGETMVDMGNATAGGDVIVTGNTGATVVDMNSPAITSDVVVTGNTGPVMVDMGDTTVGGDVIVTGNTGTVTVSVGDASVGGDVMVEVSGSTNVDLSGVTAAGDVNISAEGAETVSAQTGGSNTVVSITTASAAVSVQLTNGTFETNVTFTIQELAPATLPASGTTLSAAPVVVDALSAYQFSFAVPTLNADAALSLSVTVAELPDPPAFLAALDAGRVTLAVMNDTPGSPWLLFDVCAANQPPITDACVQIAKLDASGVPLPDGSPEIPTTVRIDGLVGHFSSYALVTFVPQEGFALTHPAVTNGAFSFSFSTLPGSNYTVQFTDTLTPPDWQSLTNVTGTGAPLQVSDEPLTNAQRFYRVQSP